MCMYVSKPGLESLNLTLQEIPIGKVVDEPQSSSSFDLLLEIQTGKVLTLQVVMYCLELYNCV